MRKVTSGKVVGNGIHYIQLHSPAASLHSEKLYNNEQYTITNYDLMTQNNMQQSWDYWQSLPNLLYMSYCLAA